MQINRDFIPGWAYPETGDFKSFIESSPRNWGLLSLFRGAAEAANDLIEASGGSSETLQKAIAAAEALESQITNLQKQILDLTESNATLRKAGERTNIQTDGLLNAATARIAELEKQLATKSSDNQGASEAIAALHAQVAASKAEISRLEALLAAAQLPDGLKEQLSLVMRERDEARAMLQDVQDTRGTDSAKFDALNQQIQALREQLAAAASDADAASIEAELKLKASEARRLRDLDAQRAQLEAACLQQLADLRRQFEAACAASNVPSPVADVVHDDAEAAPILLPAPGPVPTADGAPVASHSCSQATPTAMQPLFTTMANVNTGLNGQSDILRHFIECRTGLLAHLKRESGLRWTSISKEAPASGTTYPRYSYGPTQILDNTGAGMYALRSRLGPYSGKIKQLDKALASGEQSAKNKAELTRPDPGAYYVTLMLLNFERWLNTYFNGTEFVRTGKLTAITNNDANKFQQSLSVAKFINEFAATNPDIDPVAVLFRLFNGASSIGGVANSAKPGNERTANSLSFLVKFAREGFGAESASA